MDPIPIVVDACFNDQRALPNGHHFSDPLTLHPNHAQGCDLEKPMDYDYAITDTSEEPDYPSRGRSPPAHCRRDRAPSTIPLPESCATSDYNSNDGETPTADEMVEPSILNLNPTSTTNGDVDPSTLPLPQSSAGSDYLDTDTQMTPTNEAIEPSLLASKDGNTQQKYTSDMEKQPITDNPEPRNTVAANTTPPTEYPDLAFIGTAHASSPYEIPSANLDDDLTMTTTTETHNDRHVLDSSTAVGV